MTSEPEKYADRIYRSGSALVAGVVLLGLVGWLAGDALLRGDGRTPVTAASTLLFVAPLVIAFTLRPAVFASDERLRVRNPFRTITAPWSAVETIHAGYSTELVAGGVKYQMWAIPVSLRARSKANRRRENAEAGRAPRSFLGLGGPIGGAADVDAARPAPGDMAVAELRELAERHGRDETEGRDGTGSGENGENGGSGENGRSEVVVRWSYEILAPLALGGVALLVLWLTS
ncbi:PH domain-containing protein [Streptomyces triticirhizae]|uniref:PH domain-containing protein n=1 Tax=Streptomyces triticirhizae TaxID=2483353 RepID=A0A3M2M6Y4_9ACTN|nr:PH domain-containing protein [Streptomyces triticirhizae]RMI45564.1 PH domain-containing protein [Streptomyces triticirhizae]